MQQSLNRSELGFYASQYCAFELVFSLYSFCVLWPVPSSLQVITKVDRLRNTGTPKRKMLLILYVTPDSIRSIFLFVVPVFLRLSNFVITCDDDDDDDDDASNNSSF